MEEAEIRDTLIKMIKDYLPDLADKPLTMWLDPSFRGGVWSD